MQNERQRILELVEKGTISAQEAITLLEALEQPNKSTESSMNDASNTDQQSSAEKEPIFKEEQKRKRQISQSISKMKSMIFVKI